jgi:hypothetical protein
VFPFLAPLHSMPENPVRVEPETARPKLAAEVRESLLWANGTATISISGGGSQARLSAVGDI